MKVVIDELANYLSISPKHIKFLPSVCLVPAGFSAAATANSFSVVSIVGF